MLNIEELKEIWLKSAIDRPDLMKRAEEGIEQNRKGNCRLLVTDKEGNPLKNTEVSVNQISHDFKFGAHIFMLDEFDEPADNEKYRAFRFHDIFL